ncbi:MAG TPA: hypothetical protein VL574_09735 [Stellaceae bacterium]|nr:hypothetical protein [Stellaceae bacterium]
MRRTVLRVALGASLLLPMLLGLPLLGLPPLASRAHADSRPPRYDTDALCDHVSNTPDGFSEETKQRCLVDQDDALDALRHKWEDIPEDIQNDCDQRARAGGDADYQTLQDCIRVQMRQREVPLVIPGTVAPPAPPAN